MSYQQDSEASIGAKTLHDMKERKQQLELAAKQLNGEIDGLVSKKEEVEQVITAFRLAIEYLESPKNEPMNSYTR